METPDLQELHANLFENPSVKVAGYQEYKEEIQVACNVIFGRMLEPEEFAELISAPNDSELTIEARYSDGSIQLKLGYRMFNGTHDYILYVDDETDVRVIEFENITNQDTAPKGLETLLFAQQVQSFRKYGMEEIRLYAEGYAGHPVINGYYVWARFGFVMYLTGFGPRLAAAGFEPVETTVELFNQDNGADWWYNNGSAREAVFYLDENSESSLAFQAYLEEIGMNVDGDSDDQENEVLRNFGSE